MNLNKLNKGKIVMDFMEMWRPETTVGEIMELHAGNEINIYTMVKDIELVEMCDKVIENELGEF